MSKFPLEKTSAEGPPAYPAAASVPMEPPGSYIAPRGPFGVTFACMLLSRSDRIRLIGFTSDVIAAVEGAIARVWAAGIQNRGEYSGGGYEWKLSGHPWYGQGSEAVPSRRLVAHVLHALGNAGWHLAVAADLSKKGWDKDTLFFKPGPPRQRYFFSVSFNESDKVRLIDSPNPQVTSAFQAAVSSWPLGIQDVKEKEHNCLQIKLRGRPWYSSDGAQVNHARLLACNIMSALDAHGFELVGSIDMSAKSSEDYGELDSWFFADKSTS